MKKTSRKIVVFLSFCICCMCFSSFINSASECQEVKNGTFHFYPNSGQKHSIIVRKDTLQTEINVTTGDTTRWRVNWITNCEFTTTLMSSSKQKSKEEVDFYNSSTLKFKISSVSKDYYTYEALFTYNNNSRRFSDTMWLHEK